MNKPLSIQTQVKTDQFTVELVAIMGGYHIEARVPGHLEAFLVAIGMDSEKRMGLIYKEDNTTFLVLDDNDFFHALYYLGRLT